MTQQFFICGYPRCRTAWFSVAMSTLFSVCYHEPSADLDSFEGLVELWKPTYGQRIGVSDSALTMQLDRILEEIGPKTIIIERPIPQVMVSLQNYFRGTELMVDYDAARAYLGRISQKIDSCRDHPLVRTVKYDALWDYKTVHDVIEWLAPNLAPMDLKTLMTMNIQADRDFVLSRINKPHTDWHNKQWQPSGKSATA